MTPIIKATLQASIGALLGNRTVKYALGGGVIPVNKTDYFAVGVGAVTPVILSHIAKKSLNSITGFHGMTGCAIAGILTYLLHEKKGTHTMFNNNTQTQKRNPSQSCYETFKNTSYQYLVSPVSSMFSAKKPLIAQSAIEQESSIKNDKLATEKDKVIKKNIAAEAMVGFKKLQKKSNTLTEHYTKEIDKQIPLIKETINELLEDCSPENIRPFTEKTVHILSKLKEKKGSELKKSYTEINNNTLKPLYELHNHLQELHNIIEECNSINGSQSALFFQEDRNHSKADSHKMTKKNSEAHEYSQKILSILGTPDNELQRITKEITTLVAEHAQKSYTTALLENVNYLVSDIASPELLQTQQFKSLQAIIDTLPVPELEKFRDFAYETLDLKVSIDQNKNGRNLDLDELEKKVRNRLSDTVIDTLNQSKTLREKAEKKLYHLLRDVKLHGVGIKKLYPKPIDISKAEAELDELKYVFNNDIDVSDSDPEIQALKERFKKL